MMQSTLLAKHEPFTYRKASALPGMTEAQTMGLKWERWAAKELQAKGWEVVAPHNFNSHYDFTISKPNDHFTLHCEVKAATVTRRFVRAGYYRPRYQFCLGNPKPFERLFILVALSQDTGQICPFIVPSFDLGERSHVQLTSSPENYKGRLLKEFLGNWEQAERCYLISKKYQSVRTGQLSFNL